LLGLDGPGDVDEGIALFRRPVLIFPGVGNPLEASDGRGLLMN
jgi:hypothetical protein